jgi:hypothetical protein
VLKALAPNSYGAEALWCRSLAVPKSCSKVGPQKSPANLLGMADCAPRLPAKMFNFLALVGHDLDTICPSNPRRCTFARGLVGKSVPMLELRFEETLSAIMRESG